MPFYQLVAIASHYDKYKPIRDLVRSTALHIMEHGGHVRTIKSWGTQTLPEKMRRHKVTHEVGDYFVVEFDCSPITLKALDDQYRVDPRVIRWTNIKLGDKIKDLIHSPAKTINWGSNPNTHIPLFDPSKTGPFTSSDVSTSSAPHSSYVAPTPKNLPPNMQRGRPAKPYVQPTGVYGAGASEDL
ncbi:Mitochondrial ribosomal protein MRP17 [Phaffia rhodozyma]|uniref:Mitochondrial ribosomal protein MRP17 n=1 Tax=Phaffia rhodozyma TaxID=264483 RepID=A0A0F7SJV9_PHARH|nr:Mitochondrial ribosomal protein MRP17 [Phaffia rhodozyma]